MASFRALSRCLVCESTNLYRFLDLGAQPLANSFHDGMNGLSQYPLGLQLCTGCYHVQNVVSVDPEALFADYPYVSGTTQTLRDYFDGFASDVTQAFAERKSHLRVLDIASNDGSLLAAFKARGHDVLGIDPAKNLYPVSQKAGIPTKVAYWNTGTQAQTPGPYDVIVAMNVLGHVMDPVQFLSLCRMSLAQNGRLYVQTSQARMVERGEFDTCYHEHLSFFSARSFARAAQKAGLHIVDMKIVPIHGDSYLLELRHREIGESEGDWMSVDAPAVYDPATYRDFQDRVIRRTQEVRAHIEQARKEGFRVVGYGAAAKAMTFINAGAIDLDFIIDDNPLKVGKLTPGRNVKIVGPDQVASAGKKVFWVLTAWNFKDEIKARIAAKRDTQFDRFLTYFPEVTVE